MRTAVLLVLGASFFLVTPSASAAGWDSILKEGWTPPASYPISGYSEKSPPYFQGVRAYETFLDDPSRLLTSEAFSEFVGKQGGSDFYRMSWYEELRHVQPGLQYLAKHWLKDLEQLAGGDSPGGNTLRGIPAAVVNNNPYWSKALVRPNTAQTIVSLTPLALSRIQESLGRLHPWTVYGGSQVDWEEVFWERSLPSPAAPWICGLLKKAYDSNIATNCNLEATGVRILTTQSNRLPPDLRALALAENVSKQQVAKIRYLFTFRPVAGASRSKAVWPAGLQQAYAKGKFAAIPHPSTLLFSEAPLFDTMTGSPDREALQLPLAQEFSQFSRQLARLSFYGLLALDVSHRKSRFTPPAGGNRFTPPADEKQSAPTLIGSGDATGAYQAIFQAVPDLMGLYDKPTAQLIQLWAVSGPLAGRWLLDGPRATRTEIDAAAKIIQADAGKSRIHYRNYYPPMQVNGFEVTRHRPLVAWTVPSQDRVEIDTDLLGSVRFHRGNQDIWLPTALVDSGVEKELAAFQEPKGSEPETTALNVKKLQEFQRLLHEKLPEDLATALLNPVVNETDYAAWKRGLPAPLSGAVSRVVHEGKNSPPFTPLTFASTTTNDFEHRYWAELVRQTEGTFVHKNNCDCAAPSADPNGTDEHCDRNHLPALAAHLKDYYKTELKLPVFAQAFTWKVNFAIPWWEGLRAPQENIIVVIHGKDGAPHEEAVILADHYDTAYMADVYEGKNYHQKTDTPATVGHRHASKGADDNHSGTVALMEAARALKDLQLKRDVWLVHITGEEFPADGLGTRNLLQALVERQQLIPSQHLMPGRKSPKIVGWYQLDMIGHSTERDQLKPGETPKPAIFQISPGRGERAAGLAKIAHEVTRAWNQRSVTERWDVKHSRHQPWRRVLPGRYARPELGKFLSFRGEIRPGWHFRSSLFNTDAQQQSDTGVPSVLFMENYDIDRSGYHDTLDNIENIDLDFARGMTSIAIESVAQAATR